MGLFETLARIPKILEANINAMIDRCEDPEKMIDQLLVDYKRDLADVKRDTVRVMADLDIAKKRLDECDKEIEKMNLAAMNALRQNKDDDARKIIARKQEMEGTRASLAQNYEVCLKNSEMMQAGYHKLLQNIDSLEQRREAVKAKLALAKAQEQINKTASIASSNKVVESFAKYEDRAERALARANAAAQLDLQGEDAVSLTEKYSGAGNATAVDDELAALKASLGM